MKMERSYQSSSPIMVTEVDYSHFLDTGVLSEPEIEDLLYRTLKYDLDTTRITEQELKEYQYDPVAFAEYELHFATLTEKQKMFLRSFVKFKNPYTIIKASRGSGKTFLLSILILWLVVCFPNFQICIVSGSFEQSLILYNYCVGWIYDNPRIAAMLYKEPVRNITMFLNNSWFKCLTSSERQVRGPHPNCVIVDEAVLVKPTIYKSSLGMLGDRKPMLLVVSSTPQNDVGIVLFRDLWDNPDFQQNQYHWTAYDCPWKDPREIERKKRQMSKDEFVTDMLGEFSSITGAIYDVEDILKARITFLPQRDTRMFCRMGIDWGRGEHTCVVVMQKNVLKHKYEVLWVEYYVGRKFTWILNRIAKLYEYFDVNEIYADASHESENERLEDIYNLNLSRVAFGKMIVPKTTTRVEKKKSIKEVMIRNSQEKMELGMLEIPSRDYALAQNLPVEVWKKIPRGPDVLIRQLRNYHRDDKGKIVKEDDHGCDAMQLSLFGFAGGNTPVEMEGETEEVEML
jgi:hypothetical protein